MVGPICKGRPGQNGTRGKMKQRDFSNDDAIGYMIILARGDVPDEWRSLKKVKNTMLLITDRCRSHASAA